MNKPVVSLVRVVIADDHQLYLDGLKQLLTIPGKVEVVGMARNGEALVEVSLELEPDIIFTDLGMPVLSGIAAIRKIMDARPLSRIVVLSTLNSDHALIDSLEAGAIGYLHKTSDRSEILDAIEKVMCGLPHYCHSTSDRLAHMIARSRFNPYTRLKACEFTERELEIIRLICDERTSREIAGTVNLSVKTVEQYRSRIMDKMRVRTTTGLVIYAMKNNLLNF